MSKEFQGRFEKANCPKQCITLWVTALALLFSVGCQGLQKFHSDASDAVEAATPEVVGTVVDSASGTFKGLLNGFIGGVASLLKGIGEAIESWKGLGDIINLGNLISGGVAAVAG